MIKLLKWCGIIVATLLAFISLTIIIRYSIYAMIDQGNPLYMFAWILVWIIVIIWLAIVEALNPY